MNNELDAYDYPLPHELIAQHPLARRDAARLLVVHRRSSRIDHAHVRDLPEILRPGDCLVLNNTQVLPARLVGYRTRTGGRWSGLFLAADPQTAAWRILCKTRGRLQPGEEITLQDLQAYDGIQLRLVTKLPDATWVARPSVDTPTLELLQRYGRVPLPHYIRGGEMIPGDQQAYQTVFAEKPGAVAAPTAGLHFTPELLDRLGEVGVQLCRITLHVGPGTFRPITAQRLEQHQMHSEWGSIDQPAVDQLRAARSAGARIIAAGTTAVRVLETAAADGTLRAWQGETELFIRPPYEFRAVDGLLTNFHLPKTTLLVLVRTFGGDALIRRAYDSAIQENYRFFSYGDAMLIL